MKDESDEDEKTALISYVNKNDKWIIDNGCSHDMTGDKNKFETLHHYRGKSVKFGNDAPCLVRGKGLIKLTDKISCKNAYWVEGLNYNLLSVAQLNKIGYQVEFHHKRAKIFNATRELIGSRDQTRGNLFYLDLSEETCLIEQLDDIQLWHKRLSC